MEVRMDGPYVVLARRNVAPRAGGWSLPGGKVEERETLEIIDGEFHFVILDYLCTPIGGSLRAGDDAREVCWAPVYDLVEYDLTPAVRRVVSMAIADERE